MPTPGSYRHKTIIMRKLIFFAAMLTSSLFASAQGFSDFKSKVTVRPTLGLNIGNECSKGSTSDALVSFKIGAIADYEFRETWGFRSGLLLTGQGGKYNEKAGGNGIGWELNQTDNPWYLEIPLDVYYSYEINDEIKLSGYSGFPIEIGLFGDYKLSGEGNRPGITIGSQKRSAFDDLSRFALCWNVGVEATWRKISLGLEYNRHLTNDGKNGTGHLQVFSINLGYNFKL